jgi:hypothetical protein
MQSSDFLVDFLGCYDARETLRTYLWNNNNNINNNNNKYSLSFCQSNYTFAVFFVQNQMSIVCVWIKLGFERNFKNDKILVVGSFQK